MSKQGRPVGLRDATTRETVVLPPPGEGVLVVRHPPAGKRYGESSLTAVRGEVHADVLARLLAWKGRRVAGAATETPLWTGRATDPYPVEIVNGPPGGGFDSADRLLCRLSVAPVLPRKVLSIREAERYGAHRPGTLADLLAEGLTGQEVRYAMLCGGRYGRVRDFWRHSPLGLLDDARRTLHRLRLSGCGLAPYPVTGTYKAAAALTRAARGDGDRMWGGYALADVDEALSGDLDVPRAVRLLGRYLRRRHLDDADRAVLFGVAEAVLGLDLTPPAP